MVFGLRFVPHLADQDSPCCDEGCSALIGYHWQPPSVDCSIPIGHLDKRVVDTEMLEFTNIWFNNII